MQILEQVFFQIVVFPYSIVENSFFMELRRIPNEFKDYRKYAQMSKMPYRIYATQFYPYLNQVANCINIIKTLLFCSHQDDDIFETLCKTLLEEYKKSINLRESLLYRYFILSFTSQTFYHTKHFDIFLNELPRGQVLSLEQVKALDPEKFIYSEEFLNLFSTPTKESEVFRD